MGLKTPRNEGNVRSHGGTLPLSLSFFSSFGTVELQSSADFDLTLGGPL